MFQRFFTELRAAKVPVSMKEYLTLLDAMQKDVIPPYVDDFYYLSRCALVKDERHIDRFDMVFGHVFKGLDLQFELADGNQVPDEWLQALTEKYLTDEEKKQIEELGGWAKMMEQIRERMEQQRREAQERGEGEDGRQDPNGRGKGQGGRFGADGYHPEGIRSGQDKSRHRRAVKVWDKREFKNLDENVELGTRNIKVALRRLRRFARTGAPNELDLDKTISETARQGYLDILMRPERRNTIKVLAFFDVGGSMDAHIRMCEELFSAAKTEFKHLEYFYFHNCLYETVWKDNRRRQAEKWATWDILNKFPHDYKVVIVGDATMSPYEITAPGGSVEHFNEEPGAVWLNRLSQIYDRIVWLNPTAESSWKHTASVQMIQDVIGPERMFPLTLAGLEAAMRELSR
jgi:uncharacterized protein with von Willebrand factor type A (vWA) domain